MGPTKTLGRIERSRLGNSSARIVGAQPRFNQQEVPRKQRFGCVLKLATTIWPDAELRRWREYPMVKFIAIFPLNITISEALHFRTNPATEPQDLAEMAWLGAQHGRWEQPWYSVAEATPKRGI